MSDHPDQRLRMDYAGAGVDVSAGDSAKRRIRSLVESSYTEGVVGAFGGFGGMFRMPPGGGRQLLVSSADGVGTKIRVAIESGRHGTIGADLVNHCVNDILVQGATPLFFLDYIAFGRLDEEVLAEVVLGVVQGCRDNGCALLGGETAEMPGVYTPPDYDLAGFIVGCVEEGSVLGAGRVRSGDALVGLASGGLHTNGYSLARRIVRERMGLAPGDPFPGSGASGQTPESAADVLLTPHVSYLRALQPVLGQIHALAHITGGGIPGNLDRALPPDRDAIVDLSSWRVPNVFVELQRAGDVADADMFRTFNMGVGMVAICDPGDVGPVIQSAERAGIGAWTLGEVRPGSGRVQLN